MPRPVFFLHYGDEWIRGSERVLLDLLEGVDRRQWEPLLICNNEALAVEARRLGVETIVEAMPVPRARLPRRGDAALMLRLATRLRRRLRASRRAGAEPLLHVNSAAPCQWAAPLARLLRVPLLVHLHANYLAGSRFAFLLHAADRIVGVSRHTLDGVSSDGVDQGRLRVIHNGVNPSRFSPSPRPEAMPSPGTLNVVSVGSLIERKGHDRLIRAVAKASDTVDIRLTIVGGGPLLAQLQALAEQEGLADRVALLGDRPVTSTIFEAADVFALASRHETFGLVLAEAGLHGLAVVATPVGGVPEVVEDGETGWLIGGDDLDVIAGFAERFRALAADPVLRQTMGEAGRRRVKADFSTQGMVRRFEDLWEEMAVAPRRFFVPLGPYRALLRRLLPS